MFEEAGKEAVTRRPYRRVTLPGKVTLPPATTLSGDLDKAFRVEDQEATLTIRQDEFFNTTLQSCIVDQSSVTFVLNVLQ